MTAAVSTYQRIQGAPLETATGIGALPVFNVRNPLYGATGNGTTVDTTAFTAAITACVAAGGGIVYVPAGTYVVSGLALASNITLQLAAGAVLLLDPAQSSTYIARVCAAGTSAVNVWVVGGTFNGNQSTYGNASNARNIGYYLGVTTGQSVTNCGVVGTEFTANKTYALDVECQAGGTMNYISVLNNYIHDNGFTTGTGTNISCDGVTVIGDDITVSGNMCVNNSASGINVGQTGTVWHRAKILGNTCAGNGIGGIVLHDGMADSTVQGNVVKGNGVSTSSSAGYGIGVTSGSTNNTVTGNTSIGNYVNGIRIDAATYNTISGNTLDGNAQRGASDPEIYLANVSTNNVVANNVINASTATNAISEQSNTSGPNIVTGNMVKTGTLNPQGTGSRWTHNYPYQPQGHSVSQPAMPLTTVSATIPAKTAQQDCMVYVTAGAAATTIAVAGTTALIVPALGVGSVYVPAGSTVTPTYASGSPTWAWFGV